MARPTYTITNEGTDDDPSWVADDDDGNHICDGESLMDVIAQAEMFARANEVTKIVIDVEPQ